MVEALAHILVVDDDDRLRELLKRYLSENGYRVTAAHDASDARARLKGLEFDLIVLDLMMPGESGLELAQNLRRTNDVPILLLTAMDEPSDRIAGLEAGADDYLGKPFEPRELVLRIEAILRRARSGGEQLEKLKLGDCQFDVRRGELRRNGAPVKLTSGEAELLRILARNPGVTIDRADLVDDANSGTLRGVDVQVTRLRRKIEPDPKTPRYLQTVWGRGYVLWPD